VPSATSTHVQKTGFVKMLPTCWFASEPKHAQSMLDPRVKQHLEELEVVGWEVGGDVARAVRQPAQRLRHVIRHLWQGIEDKNWRKDDLREGPCELQALVLCHSARKLEDASEMCLANVLPPQWS